MDEELVQQLAVHHGGMTSGCWSICCLNLIPAVCRYGVAPQVIQGALAIATS